MTDASNLKLGQLLVTTQAWSLWDDPGREGVIIATVDVNEPCLVVEIDPNRRDEFEYDVRVVCSHGVGWIYVGAFETWRLGEYEKR